MMNRQEWLNKRAKGIGGSDAAAIIGMNPYMSNVDLWEIKTGRRQPEDISGKDYVAYGVSAEPLLIQLFELDYPQYEVVHKDFDMIKHPKYDFLFGSLDGQITDKATGEKGVLEIKTTNILQSMQNEKWNDRVPDNYFCQVLQYLLVTGYSFAILKAQLKYEYDGEPKLTTKHYRFEAKDYAADMEYLLAEEIKFWECVQKDVPPALKLPPL